MKPHFKTFPHFHVLARTLLAAVAVLALATAHTFAAVVNATYTTGAEVPVSSNGFTATGNTMNFSNLAQGQTMALSSGGVTYHFVAN